MMARDAGLDSSHEVGGRGWSGQDAELYNYFRDFDPAIGRYIQSDPIGLEGGPNTYAYVEGNPLFRTDPEGLFGPGGVIGGAAVSSLMQFEICRQLGGNAATCIKCVNLVDVALSAGMGFVAPTWLGNVGRGLLGLRRTRKALDAAGGPAMGRMAANKIVGDAAGAAAATGAGIIGKINLPSFQVGCEDECKKYRLSPEQMATFTSIF